MMHGKSQAEESDASRNGGESRSHSRQRSGENQSVAQFLPPNVQQMERYLAQHSMEKQNQEMNSRSMKSIPKHCFTYDSEEERVNKEHIVAGKKHKNTEGEERGFR